MTEDALRRIFEVNFFASVALAREAARRWIEAGEPGHIFFCASCLSKFTMSYYGAYAATKSAQAMVARAMRFELGEYDIEVASVHPVTTDTGFFVTVADASGLPLTDEGLPAHAPRAFVQPPEQVARAVLKAIRRPRSEVWTSPTTKFASAVFTQFPWVLDLVLRRHTARELVRRANRS
jgi:NAD(P)-dependent dehydrogenase (short-subunit alcohol dehydrogenase family)